MFYLILAIESFSFDQAPSRIQTRCQVRVQCRRISTVRYLYMAIMARVYRKVSHSVELFPTAR